MQAFGAIHLIEKGTFSDILDAQIMHFSIQGPSVLCVPLYIVRTLIFNLSELPATLLTPNAAFRLLPSVDHSHCSTAPPSSFSSVRNSNIISVTIFLPHTAPTLNSPCIFLFFFLFQSQNQVSDLLHTDTEVFVYKHCSDYVKPFLNIL